MMRLRAAERLVFGTAGGLIADKVGISPAKACRTHGLMGIHHYLVLCSLRDRIQIMIHHPLSVMCLSARQDVTYISALYCIVAIFVHEVICLLHVALIIADRRRSLMVHHKLNAL